MTNHRRPRLVEEGKPITSMEEGDPQQEETDHDLYSYHDNSHLHSSSSDMYHHRSSLPSLSQQNQASSSLAQYLSSHYHTTMNNHFYNHTTNRNNIPLPKKRTTAAKLRTKFTIGSCDDDNDYHHETYDDDISMNTDHVEPQGPYNDADLHQSQDHRHISSFEYNHNQSSHGYNDNYEDERMIQRMEIEDIIPKPPLIVLDGANIAYAYVQTFQSTPSLSSTSSKNKRHGATNSYSTTLEPNALGIKLAVEYFLHAGCRVQVVVPAYWIRTKQQHPSSRAFNDTQHMQILHHLQQENILCCSPPTDDDDAYCIAIARREDGRSRLRRKGRHGTTTTTTSSSTVFHMETQKDGSTSTNTNSPFHSSLAKREQGLNDPYSSVPSSSDITIMDGAFIVSNDLYRDAIYRDPTHDLKRWLEGTSSSSSSVKDKYSKDGTYSQVDDIPRRISYSFADLGSIDTYGDSILDFVPNPRHALIGMIDRETRKQFYSHESF